MFFPVQTDRQTRRRPWVNYVLIALNILVFLFTERMITNSSANIVGYYLSGVDTQLYEFITYQFLHTGLMHLGLNMVFLLVFGNLVEDRLGHVAYLFFYLAGGVMAGLGHIIIEPITPVIGASGSIAAVGGGFLALYPLNYVTLSAVFLYEFDVRGYILIVFSIAMDAIRQLMPDWFGSGGVAYMAHLAGYAMGLSVMVVLLGTRLLSREPFDLVSIIKRRYFKPKLDGTFDRAQPNSSAPMDEATTEAVMARRQQITTLIKSGDTSEAARLYADLVTDYPEQTMHREAQLDLSNAYMAEGSYDLAALAYERFIAAYPDYTEIIKVKLLLGLVYTRYIDEPDKATAILDSLPRQLDPIDQATHDDLRSRLRK